jgi:predicted transposase/invertase (TIGR01784 family)
MRAMRKPFLSPRNDVIFKMLFGDGRDTDILTAFLQSALTLPAEDYAEVTVVDPHLAREHPDDKLGILDVRLKTAGGNMIDIEIQVCDHPHIRERIVFYLSRMVAGQIDEGDEYRRIKRSICIVIADFVLIRENAAYCNRYRLHDPETGSEFTDLLEVDTLELPKLPRDGDGTPLWDWLKFLDARNEEDLKMLTEKNPGVKKAVAKLMALSEDERTRMLAESREKLRRDIVASNEGAREEGRKEGREEGREEGQREAGIAIARNMLARNVPLNDVVALTGLSMDEVRALLH